MFVLHEDALKGMTARELRIYAENLRICNVCAEALISAHKDVIAELERVMESKDKLYRSSSTLKEAVMDSNLFNAEMNNKYTNTTVKETSV